MSGNLRWKLEQLSPSLRTQIPQLTNRPPITSRNVSRPPSVPPGALPNPFPNFCKAAGLVTPICEYRFHPSRNWRFDYAWAHARVALEVEGGVWKNGRHVRGKGYTNDMEKYSEAAALGWRILRVPPDQLMTGATIDLLRRTFNVKWS